MRFKYFIFVYLIPVIIRVCVCIITFIAMITMLQVFLHSFGLFGLIIGSICSGIMIWVVFEKLVEIESLVASIGTRKKSIEKDFYF